MIQQTEISLPPMRRGLHLITDEILRAVPGLPGTGIMNILLKHTSAGLTLNENADPSARADLESILDRMVPEDRPFYTHTLEGSDDMPSHAKCSIVGTSLTLPITGGRLNLGTWQGIYLCEFRNDGGRRRLVITIYS